MLDRREKLLLLSFSAAILGSLTSVCLFQISTACLEMFNKYCVFYSVAVALSVLIGPGQRLSND